jgi:hypothetical protein
MSTFGCIVYGYINQCVTMWLRTVDSLDHNHIRVLQERRQELLGYG